jgi:CheY-like chemotaxis protein
MKDVKVLVVDDNPLVLELVRKGMDPISDVSVASDGADALLKVIDAPPDLIICDYKMPGLNGRQLYEKLRSRDQTRHIPFIFVASRGEIEEKLRPLVDGVEDFIPKPFFVKDLIRRAKKVVDRVHLEKLQTKSARPGVIQGRLEEMSIMDLLQSLEMGQKSCKLTVRRGTDACQMFFSSGQCKHAQFGATEGEAAVFKIVSWGDGEFEIDFNGGATDHATITRSTTGLLMEALAKLDESNRDATDAQA